MADRIGAVVVVACARSVRGLMSELPLAVEDGLPEACVAAFDNIHTLRRSAFRSRICQLYEARVNEACRVLNAALGCI